MVPHRCGKWNKMRMREGVYGKIEADWVELWDGVGCVEIVDDAVPESDDVDVRDLVEVARAIHSALVHRRLACNHCAFGVN